MVVPNPYGLKIIKPIRRTFPEVSRKQGEGSGKTWGRGEICRDRDQNSRADEEQQSAEATNFVRGI